MFLQSPSLLAQVQREKNKTIIDLVKDKQTIKTNSGDEF